MYLNDHLRYFEDKTATGLSLCPEPIRPSIRSPFLHRRSEQVNLYLRFKRHRHSFFWHRRWCWRQVTRARWCRNASLIFLAFPMLFIFFIESETTLPKTRQSLQRRRCLRKQNRIRLGGLLRTKQTNRCKPQIRNVERRTCAATAPDLVNYNFILL